LNGGGISGSPFTRAIASGAVAAQSTASGFGGTAGIAINITIQARNAAGNPVTVGGDNVQVTRAGPNPAAAAPATDNGNGTYSYSYTPTIAGTDVITITLNGGGISGSPFNSNVAAAAATHFVCSTQPTDANAGMQINPAAGIVVTAQDQFGNTDPTFTSAVTLTITTGTGTGGAVLSGGGPVSAVAGVAAFNNASINLAGPNYTLDATGALPTVVSAAFNIN